MVTQEQIPSTPACRAVGGEARGSSLPHAEGVRGISGVCSSLGHLGSCHYSKDEFQNFLQDPVKLSRTPVLTDRQCPIFHYQPDFTQDKLKKKKKRILTARSQPSWELSHVQEQQETQERGSLLQAGG